MKLVISLIPNYLCSSDRLVNMIVYTYKVLVYVPLVIAIVSVVERKKLIWKKILIDAKWYIFTIAAIKLACLNIVGGGAINFIISTNTAH